MAESATQTPDQSKTPVKQSGSISNGAIDFIKFCLRKWWIFGIIGLAAGIAGYLYAKAQSPTFQSRVTFALDAGKNDGLSGAMNLAAQFGFGISSGQSMFDGDNILEIMKSRRMIEGVLLSVDTFDNKPTTFVDYYLHITKIKEALTEIPHLKDVRFPVGSVKDHLSYHQDSILYNIYMQFAMEDIIATRIDRKLSIYEIRVNSLNEEFTKKFTDRLVVATSNFYTDITSRKDRETFEILAQRVSSLKGNVGSSIESRAATQDANINPAFAAGQTRIIKEQINLQAYGEAYKEMFRTQEVARYQMLKNTPLVQIIDPAGYPMKKIKVGKLKTAILFSTITVMIAVIALWIFTIFRQRAK